MRFENVDECSADHPLSVEWMRRSLRSRRGLDGQDRNKDADVENGLEDPGRGKGKLGRSERVAWTYIHYQI